jgi:dihydrolipoamide dehydrogenase
MESFDLAVIGAGPGGYVAAIRAAQLGLRVALIEKEASLGGTCLNVGCIPSKALLESSELYHRATHDFPSHGITTGPVSFDLGKMMARKDKVVGELTKGIGMLMKKNKIKVLRGWGEIAGPKRVLVRKDGDDDEEIEAENTLLAMGSVPVELPFLPFDGQHIVTSTEALSFDRVPGHLVVVGAGAVGLELGSVWRRLGAQVTVIELLPTIVPFADRQVSKALEKSLSQQGLAFRLESKVSAAAIEGDTITVTVRNEKGESESVTCDKILVAVGRKPVTQGVGLEEAGVRLGENGRIAVSDHLETSLPGVYAIGDLVRGPMLAHKAEEEGVAVAERIAGEPGHVNYQAIPSVVYTWPEVAQVGLTEAEAKDQGLPIKSGRFYFKANARAKCMGEEDGLVKVISHAETDRLLGLHIMGPHASVMIAEAVTAFEFGGSAEDLARTVHAHPTLCEIIKEAAMAVERRQIHG